MINDWLDSFKANWINQDVSAVVSLFDPNVEYWESPKERLSSQKEIIAVWQEIKLQQNIQIDLKPIAVHGNRHTVLWQLNYLDEYGVSQSWRGTYIIELNDNNKCTYFLQSTNV